MSNYLSYSFIENGVGSALGYDTTSLSTLGSTFKDSFKKAVKVWTDAIDLVMMEVPGTNEAFGSGTESDIRIHAGYIDGYSGTLAFSVSFGGGPTAPGDLVFDVSDSNWWNSQGHTISVASHELGHSIGTLLGIGGSHSGNPEHLMWPNMSFDELHPKPLPADEAYRWAVTLGAGEARSNVEKVNGFEGQVYAAYVVGLDRTPENAGAIHHLKLLDNGTINIQNMYDFFASSAEFDLKYGNFSNRDKVMQVYRNALDREGDTAGIDGWTYLLDTNQIDDGDLIRGFAQSAEFVGIMQNQMATDMWYDI